MRVLQLGKFYPIKGGVEKVMYNLMLGLGQQGIECDMLCCAFPDGSIGNKKQIIQPTDHTRVIIVPTLFEMASTMISPALVRELKKLIKERHYDIIHVHHPDPMATIALYFSRYNGKVIVHWHSDIVKQKILLKFYLPFQHWLLKRADRIVGTSPIYVAGSEDLANWRFKTSYLPIGISEIQPNQDNAYRIRERYKGKKIVFSLGRSVHYKGFQFLIEALAKLPQDFVLVLGGTGELLPDLKRQAMELGVRERITFTGFIPDTDLPDWFGACNVFVLSSIMKTEAFAIVQVEAMCCSKPVVSTAIEGSGVSWVNAHRESGLVVPPRNADSLANAIIEICSDAEQYDSYCQRARQRYLKHFTDERMIISCMDIYDFVLDKKPKVWDTILSLLGKVVMDRTPDYSKFSKDPGMWRMVMNAAAAQNIYSLIYDVLPSDVPDDVMTVWSDHIKRIERYNNHTHEVALSQEKAWKTLGLKYALLKGHDIAQLYPNPTHRGCGDIDWYFETSKDWRTAYNAAKKNTNSHIFHDSDGDCSYLWHGVTIEHHHDWTHLSSRRSRRILGKPAIVNGRISPTDNLLVLNAHILHHALTSGTGLKQFADMAIAYRKMLPLADAAELVRRLEFVSLIRWTGLMHSALVELTGIDPSMLPVPASAPQKDTAKLLALIINDGIFGNAKRHRFSGIADRFLLLIRYCPRECISRYFHLIIGGVRKIL